MRNEREIIEKILDAARQDDSVRVVIRTDLVPKRKYLYTYNFCFVVNDVEKYDADVFQSCFGERILLFRGDRNYQKLLDKDGILPETERLEEKQTIFASAPSREEFDNINCEFWWVMKTFAEYTLREELLSSMFYLNNSVRDLLNRIFPFRFFRSSGWLLNRSKSSNSGETGPRPSSSRRAK